MDHIEKIRQAGAAYETGSLEAEVDALLIQMAQENAAWAELIAQDLDVKEMNISALAKKTKDYARKHRVGDEFGMNDACARKIIMDFYKLPEAPAQTEPPALGLGKKPAPSWVSVDLFDSL